MFFILQLANLCESFFVVLFAYGSRDLINLVDCSPFRLRRKKSFKSCKFVFAFAKNCLDSIDFCPQG